MLILAFITGIGSKFDCLELSPLETDLEIYSSFTKKRFWKALCAPSLLKESGNEVIRWEKKVQTQALILVSWPYTHLALRFSKNSSLAAGKENISMAFVFF